MELYTKCVEAIPLKKAIGVAVAIFIKENIICHFEILQIILSDNSTPFVNRNISNMLGRYHVKHHRSTSYYPKGNGQAEATNKTLIRILSRVIEKNLKGWADQLLLALWAYHTSKRKATGETSYALVYGEEAIQLVEIEIPYARLKEK